MAAGLKPCKMNCHESSQIFWDYSCLTGFFFCQRWKKILTTVSWTEWVQDTVVNIFCCQYLFSYFQFVRPVSIVGSNSVFTQDLLANIEYHLIYPLRTKYIGFSEIDLVLATASQDRKQDQYWPWLTYFTLFSVQMLCKPDCGSTWNIRLFNCVSFLGWLWLQ